MAQEATAKPVDAPEPEVPLFAPLQDLGKRGMLLIGGLILLANLPLIHYFFRHVLQAMPVQPGLSLPFSDDFNRAEIGPNYWSTGGDWRIENGELHAASVKNNPLWLKMSLPQDVAIDFDVRPMSPEGDVRFELFGDGLNTGSGYVFMFGAYNNQVTGIGRLGERGLAFDSRGIGQAGPASDTEQNAVTSRNIAELFKTGMLNARSEFRVQRMDVRPQVGVTYHMHLERRGADLKWFMNNELVVELNDPMPLVGKGHDRFGPSGWDTEAFFDNLTIQKL